MQDNKLAYKADYFNLLYKHFMIKGWIFKWVKFL